MDAKESFSVLIADDSEDDRLLLKRAMQRASRLQVVAEVSNGTEVIAYLKGQSQFADRNKYPLPSLILLDLHMPMKDGFDVLTWISKQDFDNLTVVVLTDSMNTEHIKRALDLGADLFQVKPVQRQDREAMILALEEYLLTSVPPPSTPANQTRLAKNRTV
jgi:CheY-like chemotaxis protein